ncbi:alpha/beta fold hydrolase [Rhodococcus maanshanensis]|uniref:alpha/beta fold hydrolase n=1 Tax=Rhodococcus maanshanensis TaxID=183556 RepID=UPI003B224198
MTTTIPGFETRRVPTADGVALHTAVGGQGDPIVLLHGFPQTHLMWRHVAADLARDHTVICPDLRGYGASDKPIATDESTYAKRTMGSDVVALARELGFERFALAGHDRGALVAFRTALDHPGAVTHLATLDVLPTLDMWEILRGADARVAWHLYLMAQPAGLPEAMIESTADAFFGSFLDGWTGRPDAIPAGVRAEYLRATQCRRSWRTTAPRRASTSSTTARTVRRAGPSRCRRWWSSRTGAPGSGTTRPPSGAPGPPTSCTARSPSATSWRRSRPRRSRPSCGDSSPAERQCSRRVAGRTTITELARLPRSCSSAIVWPPGSMAA